MTRGRVGRVAAAIGPAVGVGAVLLAVWWAATTGGGVPPLVFPSPQLVARVLAEQPGYLADHLLVTGREAILGYGLAAIAGLTAGMLVAASPLVARGVIPVLFGLEGIPKIAFAPLLVIWMGWGQSPKVAMVTVMCLLTVLYNTISGLRSTPTEEIELARSLGASRRHTFTKIRLPYALPRIFVGLKLAAPLAFIGAVIGEFLGAEAGLGWVVWTAVADTPLRVAAVLLLGAASMALLGVVAALERVLTPWVRHIQN